MHLPNRLPVWLALCASLCLANAHAAPPTVGGDPLVLCNCDDDDRDAVRDCDDAKPNGDDDLLDLGRIVVSGFPAGTTIRLQAPADRARVFVPSGGKLLAIGPDESAELTPATPGAPAECWIEARTPIDGDWDGSIAVRVTVPGVQVVEHRVRVAPLVLSSSIERATTVFVRHYPGRNDAFLSALRDGAERAKADLHVVPGDAPYPPHHIWMQDATEFTSTKTARSQMVVALPANRDQAIDLFVRDRLLGPGIGYHRIGEYRPEFGLGEGGVSWIDWCGNLEVSPPIPGFPNGRVLYGEDRKNRAQFHPTIIEALRAQGAQPPFALDVGWLTIKHVDEMAAFLPGQNGVPFFVLVPDTGAALKILDTLDDAGHGDAAVFAAYEKGTTVGSLASDAGARELNNKLQLESIEPMIVALQQELKLRPEQLLRMPALFAEGGLSRMPNMVNCLVVNGQVVMSDPCGPKIDGADPFQQAARAVLRPAPVAVDFVDDGLYHRWSGNVHCATNAIRESPGLSGAGNSASRE